MILGIEAIEAVQRGLNTSFQEAYNRTKVLYEQLSMVVNSTAGVEEWPWFDLTGDMKAWKSTLQLGHIKLNDWTITNEDYENSILIPKNDIDDDKIGVYGPLFDTMGMNAKRHPDKLLSDLLSAGFDDDCYDGEKFYSATHPIPGSSDVNDNLHAGALAAATFQTARAGLLKMKGGGSNYFNNPDDSFILAVPPELESTAESIVMADYLASGATNTNKGKARVQVMPRLATTTEWHLLNESLPIKPLITQIRLAPYVDYDAPKTSLDVVYFSHYRGACGYGLPVLAIGSPGT